MENEFECARSQRVNQDIGKLYTKPGNTPKVILCTPNVFIPQTVSQTQNSVIKVGGQNCSRFYKGAYTGETSASMLKSVGT